MLQHGLLSGQLTAALLWSVGFHQSSGFGLVVSLSSGRDLSGAPYRARHRGGGAGAQHCGLVYRMETSVTRRLDSFVGLVCAKIIGGEKEEGGKVA